MSALKAGEDLAAFAEAVPDSKLYAVLRAVEHSPETGPQDQLPENRDARKAALDYMHAHLSGLLAGRQTIEDSSNVWWAIREGICHGDNRFRDLLPRVVGTY